MTQRLAGDTGGTKTVLMLTEAEPSASHLPRLTPLYEARYVSAEYPDLVPMVRQFLKSAEAQLGYVPAPETACFSIAGPVVQNTCTLTNLSWLLDGTRLQRDLGIAQVQLINDFVAVGHGIPGLAETDIYTIQTGEPQADAPIAIIGAGTGLGEGFLIREGDRYRVFGTEGGHTDFAPRSEVEFQLLKYLRDKLNVSRISVERVVSGMGIVAIYQFLRDRQAIAESADVAQAIRQWEREAGLSEKSVDPAAVIAIAATEQRDPLAKATMELFADLYGAEAGNLALKLLPYGGLYIAGGVAAKNLPLMKSGIFLNAMINKGRMRALMERVPVHIILNEKVGLIGAALFASTL
ncbi:MAG: glucokinase [Elainella sp. Prado103]|jgi:glucokinase|nr:glucokinase [Elainella sp. Prado103]